MEYSINLFTIALAISVVFIGACSIRMLQAIRANRAEIRNHAKARYTEADVAKSKVYRDDFMCIHCGSHTIASCGDVTVIAERIDHKQQF